MPRNRTRVTFADWTGGVNEDDAPANLKPIDLRVARNVYWRGRALSARNGSSRFQATAINSGAAGTGLFELVRSQGGNRDIIAVVGDKVYKAAKSDPPTDITGTAVVTAGQNNQVVFAHFNDTAYMCNGVNTPWEWSGAGNCLLVGGSPPAFGTMISKWGRLFGAGHAAASRTVRYSDLNDAETWNVNNTVAAILGDAAGPMEGRDYINQLGHLGDSLFVGLQQSVGRIYYTGDATFGTPFRYTQLSDFGCEGRQSYVGVGYGGYWLSQRGVHFIQPSDMLISYDSSLVSGRRLRTSWDSLNKNRIKYTCGRFFRTAQGNQVVVWPLTSGSGTIHDTLLLMDVTDGPGTERFAWWTGWDANAMAVVQNASTLAEELLFATTLGFVWQGDTGTSDNGTAYLAEMATRWEDFGVPAVKKNFRDLYVSVKQSGDFSMTIETYFDYATTPSQRQVQSVAGVAQAKWGTFVWGTDLWPSLGFVTNYLPGVDDGEVLSFRIYTAAADQPWSLYMLAPSVMASGEAKGT